MGGVILDLLTLAQRERHLARPDDIEINTYRLAGGETMISVREADGLSMPLGERRQISSFTLEPKDLGVDLEESVGADGHVALAVAVCEIANALTASLRALQTAGA